MYIIYIYQTGKLNLYSDSYSTNNVYMNSVCDIKHEICVNTYIEYKPQSRTSTIFISFIQVNLLGNAVKTIVKWIS